MHRKGAQDAKRAKVFTKLIRELTVAAKSGADPENNSRLRSAIIAARVANMPKDTMDRAIKRGAGGEDDTDYQEIRYEGYGPGGTAIIVEALTDNRNRTAAEVRSYFSKFGGAMGETNSVNFQFDHLGCLTFDVTPTLSFDALFEAALEAGATDVAMEDDLYEVYTEVESLHEVRTALAKTCGEPKAAKLVWKPKLLVSVEEKNVETLFKLVNALEDNDDVQTVFGNYDIDPALLEKLDL